MSLFSVTPDRASVAGLVKPQRIQKSGLLIALTCALLPVLAGCGNPAIDVVVETLGDEDPKVGVNANHRAGQPCLHCHGPYYGASPRMAVAGTVFGNPNTADPIPVQNVRIRLFDTAETAAKLAIFSECSGNFFVNYSDDSRDALFFPLAVRIQCPEPENTTVREDEPPIHLSMQSRVSREGSCNFCHHGNRDQKSPGWVICDASLVNTYTRPTSQKPECSGKIAKW
jgi:hypothetical protein